MLVKMALLSSKRWLMLPVCIGLILVAELTGWRAVDCAIKSRDKSITMAAEHAWRQSAPVQAALLDETRERWKRCAVCGEPAVKTLVSVIVRKHQKRRIYTEVNIRMTSDRGGTPITHACERHTEWLSRVKSRSDDLLNVKPAAEYFRSHYQGTIPHDQLLSISDEDLVGRALGAEPWSTADSEHALLNEAGMWGGISVSLFLSFLVLLFIYFFTIHRR